MLLFIGIERKIFMKNRYLVSWWSGYYEDEGCKKPPFQVFVIGSKYRYVNGKLDRERDEVAICAVIDAESEEEIWEVVRKYFPDMDERFCELKDFDFKPGDWFIDFRNETSLY